MLWWWLVLWIPLHFAGALFVAGLLDEWSVRLLPFLAPPGEGYFLGDFLMSPEAPTYFRGEWGMLAMFLLLASCIPGKLATDRTSVQTPVLPHSTEVTSRTAPAASSAKLPAGVPDASCELNGPLAAAVKANICLFDHSDTASRFRSGRDWLQ